MPTSSSEVSLLTEVSRIGPVKSALAEINRALILPHLFRVRGQPYSMADHPQFETMYEMERAPDTIFMCGRQLGKSMNLSRAEILDAITIPHLQLLYVAPLQSQTIRYSTLYIKEAIASCAVACALQDKENEHLSDSNIVKAVHHQSWANGSGLQLTYAKTSPDRARGIFADMIDFDELQDQSTDNIPIISESLTASDYGARRFTGTAKTSDNTMEHYWRKSSMCEWVMRCDCGFWNIPTLEGGVLDMIQADGMHCANKKCGALLDVRKGEWVPEFPDRHNVFRGYHIPQVVVPFITENPSRWARLIRKVISLPLQTVTQEILGISCSLGSRLVTQEDIDRNSVLPGVLDLQKKRFEYAFTVGGLDWGVGEQTSFTVHTVIGVRSDGHIDVLWARRFVGFDPDEVMSEIARTHRFYGCRMLAADFGVGFDKNILLEKEYGIPVVQMQLCGQNRLLSFNPFLGHPRWSVDKTTALDLLFMAIRYNRISFPQKGDFDQFTQDLLSPYEHIVESGGLVSRKYLRNPAVPDDFTYALAFSTLTAMRIMDSSITDLVPGGVFGDTLPGASDFTQIDTGELLGHG